MPATIIDNKRQPLSAVARTVSSSSARLLWNLIPRGIYLGSSARTLYLAITRICNANCVFCPYQFEDKQDKKHMPEPLFEKIAGEIAAAGIRRVMLSPNLGEPLLAPRFIEKVETLRASGARSIEVTTNGTLLHQIGTERMLKEGPDKINIYFPGFDKAMYERLYRRPLYGQTRANILQLLRMNRTLAHPREIQIWLRGDVPVDELLGVPEMAEVKRLADAVSVMTEVDNWMGRIKEDMLPPGMKIQKEAPAISRRPCTEAFHLTVHPDGDIHLCPCRNIFKDPKLHIGDARHMTLAEALSSIPEVLNRWESGDIPRICKGCSMYGDPADGILGACRETVSNVLSRNHA